MKSAQKILFLTGGLGNVILQIRFALYIEAKLNIKVKLNCNFVSPYVIENVIKIFGSDINRRLFRIGEFYLQKRFFLAAMRRLKFWPLYVEPDEDILIEAASINKYPFILGYFQSYKYSEEFLIADIQISNAVSNRNLMRINALTERDLVVHLRFGDYENAETKKFHGVLNESYYRLAIENFKDRERLILISNDQEKALDLFRRVTNQTAEVWSGTDYDTIDDFYFLCFAKNLVIGNSSFSYCAALHTWKKRNANIVAPKSWFAKKVIDFDYRFPRGWLLV